MLRLVVVVALAFGSFQGKSVLEHMAGLAPGVLGELSVMLIPIDLNGDKGQDLLLGPASQFGNAGGPWFAYLTVDQQNGAFTYLGELAFHPFAYRYSMETQKLSYAWRAGPDERLIGRFVIGRDGVTHTNGPDCRFTQLSAECKGELDAIEHWQEHSAPPVLYRVFSDAGIPVGAWVDRTGKATALQIPDIHIVRVVPRQEQ